MAGSNLMRQLVDQIRKKIEPTAILFASRDGDSKVTLIAAVVMGFAHAVHYGIRKPRTKPLLAFGCALVTVANCLFALTNLMRYAPSV